MKTILLILILPFIALGVYGQQGGVIVTNPKNFPVQSKIVEQPIKVVIVTPTPSSTSTPTATATPTP
jgi:hypothetical protein